MKDFSKPTEKTQYEYQIELTYSNLTEEDFDELLELCENYLDALIEEGLLRKYYTENKTIIWECELEPFYETVVSVFLLVKRRRRISLKQFKVLGKFCKFPITGIDPPQYQYF
jgi:hypothetical protein